MKELVDGDVQLLNVPEVRPCFACWAESSCISKFFSWECFKNVPIWAEKIILPAFSTKSSAIFTLREIFAVDSTASSKDIPELKDLIHYLGKISLKPSWIFLRIGERGRSCEALCHYNKHRTPTPCGAMTENRQWLTNHFDICSCVLF